MIKFWKTLFVLSAVMFMASCGDDGSSEKDLWALGEGDRIPREAMPKFSNAYNNNDFSCEYKGTCEILVFGPEDGYAENTWHFSHFGMDYLWPAKNLHFLGYHVNDEYRIMGSEEQYDDGDYYTPLFRAQTFNGNTGDFMTYTTPDGRRTYEIYASSVLYAYLGNSLVLLPDNGSSADYLYACVKDTYKKGTNTGTGPGSGGSDSGTDRVATKVFEVWVYTSGWDRTVKTDTHSWYKGEMAGKMCLFKTRNTSNFMVASRNNDRTCEGYSVSQYDYKVTEQTITAGTYYYYFN